jgi:hypothetical protein
MKVILPRRSAETRMIASDCRSDLKSGGVIANFLCGAAYRAIAPIERIGLPR